MYRVIYGLVKAPKYSVPNCYVFFNVTLFLFLLSVFRLYTA
jgi:hypothetical protein